MRKNQDDKQRHFFHRGAVGFGFQNRIGDWAARKNLMATTQALPCPAADRTERPQSTCWFICQAVLPKIIEPRGCVNRKCVLLPPSLSQVGKVLLGGGNLWSEAYCQNRDCPWTGIHVPLLFSLRVPSVVQLSTSCCPWPTQCLSAECTVSGDTPRLHEHFVPPDRLKPFSEEVTQT